MILTNCKRRYTCIFFVDPSTLAKVIKLLRQQIFETKILE